MWVIRFADAMVDHHLALVTHDNESLGEGHDLLNIETLSWVVIQRASHFSTHVTEEDLTLVGAHKDFALGQPAVRRVILRNVAVLFLLNLTHLEIQVLVLLDEVLVGLISRD